MRGSALAFALSLLGFLCGFSNRAFADDVRIHYDLNGKANGV